jgi:hypothetical protein
MLSFFRSEVRYGLFDVWFLSFDESVHSGIWLGVWRKRTFWKVDEVERI